ncbi:MAG: glycosyltransferase, partial [Verrucomicrobiota bacterium]|nr:glycosyltransferase [Verrucomicrobiota bacterium]
AVADCAVLPSAFGETWGLVVNEAQIFGLPVIVSDRVGCFPDLVTPKTGRVFPSGDESALVDALKSAIPWVRTECESIAVAARAKAMNYTSERAAAAIANAAMEIAS